jgi:hypothetical protein
MKVEIKVKKEFNLAYLSVYADVRYWEDSTVNGNEDTDGELIPCRFDDTWMPVIEIETGRIINWDKGTTANIHYKVCDGFSYSIEDDNEEIVIEESDIYVPCIMYPKANGCGDYIIMNIDENGFIENWNKKLILELIDEYNQRQNC